MHRASQGRCLARQRWSSHSIKNICGVIMKLFSLCLQSFIVTCAIIFSVLHAGEVYAEMHIQGNIIN